MGNCPIGAVRPAKLHENRPTSDKSEVATLTPLISARLNLRPQGFSTLPFRAYGPRNFMKIVESRSTMGNRRERRGRTHSGAVEAVTLPDPERA
jgi:hypothetical protein